MNEKIDDWDFTEEEYNELLKPNEKTKFQKFIAKVKPKPKEIHRKNFSFYFFTGLDFSIGFEHGTFFIKTYLFSFIYRYAIMNKKRLFLKIGIEKCIIYELHIFFIRISFNRLFEY